MLLALSIGAGVAAPQASAREASAPAAAEAVIEAASRYIGLPYKLGTEGPDRFDCSGLIFRAFSDAGRANLIGGRRIRAAGYMRWFAGHGRFTTDTARLRRGDLVMYDHGSHIGIYVGNGRVLSAVLSGVTIHPLDGLTQAVTGFLRVDWKGEGDEAGEPLQHPAPPDDAEEPAELVPASSWAPAPDGAAAALDPDGIEREDMRTTSSRTFEQGDGSFITELFSHPIYHRPSEDGPWQPIDLRLQPSPRGSQLVVASSPVSVALDTATRRGSFAHVDIEGQAIGLGAVGMSRGAAVEPVLGQGGQFADYSGIFGDSTGLRIFPRADGLKAFLVLVERPSSDRFTLALEAGSLSPAIQADGSVALHDADGLVLARFAPAKTIGSADSDGRGGGISTDAASLSVEGDGERTLLEVSIDRAYLARASYPVYVDLSLARAGDRADTGASTFVLSTRPDAGFEAFQRPEWPAYPELWHGQLPGRQAYSEAYLRFADPPLQLAGASVHRADLRVFPYWQQRADAPTWVAAPTEVWDPATLTWQSRPASVELGTFTSNAGTWAELDLTEHVRQLLAGERRDHGLLLHANPLGGRGWKRIAADVETLEPRLVVHWTGLRPIALDTQLGADWDGTLAWLQPAVAPDQWRFEVRVTGDEMGSSFSSGVVKGSAGRQQAWQAPLDQLVPSQTYSWQVRARYGPGTAWSDWSEPARLVHGAPPADGSDDAQALGEEEHAEDDERPRSE